MHTQQGVYTHQQRHDIQCCVIQVLRFSVQVHKGRGGGERSQIMVQRFGTVLLSYNNTSKSSNVITLSKHMVT